MSGQTSQPFPERRVAKVASRQHGIVTAAQLLEVGVSRRMIEGRVRSGRFVRLHRGIYRTGPVVGPRAHEMAAVLAAGEGACLSHSSAACIFRLFPRRTEGDEPDVLVTRRGVRQPASGGFRIHYTTSLPDHDRTVRSGLPVTSPERTILDLAAQVVGVGAQARKWRAVTRRDLEQAVATAEREGQIDLESLRARLERQPHRAGTGLLREILDLEGGPAFTRSVLEAEFLELVRSAAIPIPETNVRVGHFELDMFWRRERVAVEVDGYRYHRGHDHFEGDRARDSDLASRGILVVRFTAKRIREHPLAVIAELAQVLGRRAPGQRPG